MITKSCDNLYMKRVGDESWDLPDNEKPSFFKVVSSIITEEISEASNSLSEKFEKTSGDISKKIFTLSGNMFSDVKKVASEVDDLFSEVLTAFLETAPLISIKVRFL